MTSITIGSLFLFAGQANPNWRDEWRASKGGTVGALGDEGDDADDETEAEAEMAADADDVAETKTDADANDEPGDDADDEHDADADENTDTDRAANEAPVAKMLPVIRIKPRISVMTTATEAMLIDAKVPFYDRGGKMVRPIVRSVKAAHGHTTRTAQLKPVTDVYLRDTMCRHAIWRKYDARKNQWVSAMAPKDVAETLLERDGVGDFQRSLA